LGGDEQVSRPDQERTRRGQHHKGHRADAGEANGYRRLTSGIRRAIADSIRGSQALLARQTNIWPGETVGSQSIHKNGIPLLPEDPGELLGLCPRLEGTYAYAVIPPDGSLAGGDIRRGIAIPQLFEHLYGLRTLQKGPNLDLIKRRLPRVLQRRRRLGYYHSHRAHPTLAQANAIGGCPG